MSDLGCFSYLAAADVITVAKLPAPNDGSPIVRRRRSLAGDGPLVATFASGLGLRTAVVANGIGADADGVFIDSFLARNDVRASLSTTARTRYALILEDGAADREWFVETAGLAGDLADVSLAGLERAGIRYVDFYPIIETAATRCLALGGDLYVNLGGEWPSDEAAAVLRQVQPAFIQTSAPAEQAEEAAERVRRELGAVTAIATCGPAGAVVHGAERPSLVRAPSVPAATGHGAGAAFSAAMIAATLDGQDTVAAAELACAHASLHCREGAERYTLEAVKHLMNKEAR